MEEVLVYVLGQVPLTGPTWVLLSYGAPDQPTKVQPGTSITALFYDDGSVTGVVGCNTYAAGYTVQDGGMTITPPASTLMMCPLGMEQETAYLTALGLAESYTITGPKLEISYGGGTGKLTYTTLSLPLEYTLWALAALNGAAVFKSPPAALA